MSTIRPEQYPRSICLPYAWWQEEVGGNQTEWRGKIHLITNGNVYYFREGEGRTYTETA